MGQNEKTPGAGSAPREMGRGGEELNPHQHNNKNGGRKQAESSKKDAWNRSQHFLIAEDIYKLKIAVEAACKCKTQGETAEVYAQHSIPVFPCDWRPKPKAKSPLCKGGLYDACATLEVVQRWWKQWPLALIGVPGGRRVGFWFLDVDAKGAHEADGLGAWAGLEAQHGSVHTRSHLTGTAGLHLIYKWDPNHPVGCSTGRLPKGMEVKGEGGYVIFPPSPYARDGQTLSYRTQVDCDPEPAPAWLYELILSKRDRAKTDDTSAAGTFAWSEGFGKKKLKGYCELIQSAQQHHWDEACRTLFYFGRLCGGGACDPQEALKELLKAARANKTAPPDYLGKVERSFLNGVAEPTGPFSESASLEDFRAYLPQHNYIYIPTRDLWPASSINSCIPTVDKGIKANVWLDQHRPVQQMTWAPGEEMLIRDRLISDGGWFEKEGVTCFNLYKPPTIEPGDTSKAGPWIAHVRNVYPEDADHIIAWCAQRVQHPQEKINHCLLLIGAPGIGKDTLLEPVRYAIGPWNFAEVSPQHLLGRFNGFLKSVILRVNEVRDLGELSRYSFYEHMKTMLVTPPHTLRVDEKNLREHQVLNCVGIVATSNHKTDGIYLPADDRRHYVAWSSLTSDSFTEDYWNKLWHWYEKEDGYRHIAAFLAAYDLSQFDPKAPPPKTPAFWAIVDANRAPEESELADILDALGNPRAMCLNQICEKSGVGEFGEWLLEKKNRKAVSHQLERCGYVPVRNPYRKSDGFWLVNGTRQVIYVKSELSLRDQIEAAARLSKSEESPGYMQ